MAEFLRNADGSTIVKLSAPIQVGGEELTRVTIPKLKGKHLKRAAFATEVTIGHLVALAAEIVQPAGAVDEMEPDDALAVANEVASVLGKARPGGA